MKNKIYILVLFCVSLLLVVSCKKDLEELNQDPHGFTTASTGSLFNGILESLQLTWDEQFYINNEILYKQSQLGALTNSAWGNYTIGTESLWTNYYLIMPNVRELENRFDEMDPSGELNNMKAMVKIVVAYKTFKLTDIFGDIPFFEAGYGFEDLEKLHPKYDSQRDIYLHLLDELQWCDSIISDTSVTQEPFLTFSDFDGLFNGDVLKWQKFANSLRMRYAMRMSEKEPELAGNIIGEIVENDRPLLLGYDFITYVGESACMWPAAMGFKNPSVSWSFREHKNLRMGSNIWHQMSENDNINGSGIFDPRAYIFFETNDSSLWRAYPQFPESGTPPSGGIPYDSHRDGAAAFSIKGEDCIYSPFNYFLLYDEDFIPIILTLLEQKSILFWRKHIFVELVFLDEDMANDEYLNGINCLSSMVEC